MVSESIISAIVCEHFIFSRFVLQDLIVEGKSKGHYLYDKVQECIKTDGIKVKFDNSIKEKEIFIDGGDFWHVKNFEQGQWAEDCFRKIVDFILLGHKDKLMAIGKVTPRAYRLDLIKGMDNG